MKPYKVEFYRDRKKGHRWRIITPNGKVRADSGQGYTRKIDCRKALQDIWEHFRAGAVEMN